MSDIRYNRIMKNSAGADISNLSGAQTGETLDMATLEFMGVQVNATLAGDIEFQISNDAVNWVTRETVLGGSPLPIDLDVECRGFRYARVTIASSTALTIYVSAKAGD